MIRHNRHFSASGGNVLDKRKIKDIYQVVQGADEYPLQRWYNQLIDKSIDELSVSDVTKMVRQDIFVEQAVGRAVEYLEENPFSGDLYEGEVLYMLYKLDGSYYIEYADKLNKVLECAMEQNRKYEWLLEEERDEFDKLVKAFKEKIWELRK